MFKRLIGKLKVISLRRKILKLHKEQGWTFIKCTNMQFKFTQLQDGTIDYSWRYVSFNHSLVVIRLWNNDKFAWEDIKMYDIFDYFENGGECYD